MKKLLIIIILLIPVFGFSQFYDIENNNYVGVYNTTFDYLDSSNQTQTANLELHVYSKDFIEGSALRGHYFIRNLSNLVLRTGGVVIMERFSINENKLKFFLTDINCDERWHTFFEFNDDFTELSWGEFERKEPEGARVITPDTPEPCYEMFLPENLTLTKQ